MSVTDFENARWSASDQKVQFRHRAAADMIQGGSVLDLGCGDGLLFELLGSKIERGLGLDISPEAVHKAREKGFEALVHSFDEPLPLEDDSFDYAVLLDVLEHVYDPVPLLREAGRVAKEVIVGVPNFSSLPARLQVLLGQVPENNSPHKGHIYWFNHSVLRRVAKQAGVRIAELRMNTFSPASLFGDALVQAAPNLLALSFVARMPKEEERDIV
ncbi:MAG TPA: methionine biosynthesis protein MetW [Candidatus Paceibacterota bacterium]|nr:methionine biosynthesis protein MetW [Candidatus Paceibacterota bacterium]